MKCDFCRLPILERLVNKGDEVMGLTGIEANGRRSLCLHCLRAIIKVAIDRYLN